MYKRVVLSSFFILTALILFACSSPPDGISKQAYELGKKHVKEIEDCSTNQDCDDDDLSDKLVFELDALDSGDAEYKDSEVMAATFTSLTSLMMLKIEESYAEGESNKDLTEAKVEYRIEIDNLRKTLGEKPKYD
ncbi:hypothetical protein ACI2JA_04160 [Alkalihalobacillus sp. NPDC078783]